MPNQRNLVYLPSAYDLLAGDRIETGPVQFGDDWPGVFIRGDNAFAYGMAIEAALMHLNSDDIHVQMARSQLEGLLSTLRSSMAVPSTED